MNDPRWRRIEDICHGALEREPEERDTFVRASCGGDESLRFEVESLLANATQAQDSGLGIRDVELDFGCVCRYSPKHTMVEPTASATNCCPPTAKVIGEVLMVAFSGTRHNVFPSRSSTATK